MNQILKLVFLLVFLLNLHWSFAQRILVEWNFPNDPDNSTADGGITANLTKQIVAVGTSAPSFSFAGASTNSARATGWQGGQDTKYWEIEFSTLGYTQIALSSKQRSSPQGPKDFKVQYKIGAGGTWTDVDGGVLTVLDNFTTGVITNLLLPADCNNQTSVYIRWLMTSNVSVEGGVVSSVGASRIDDIQVVAIEPSNPLNVNAACVVNNAADIVWIKPSGTKGVDWDGVVLFARQGSPVDAELTPTDDGASMTGNSNYAMAVLLAELGWNTKINNSICLGNFTADADGNVSITGLTPSSTYYFKAFTYKTGSPNKWSLGSNELQITTVPQLNNVQNPTVTSGNGQLTLNWQDPISFCGQEIVIIARQGAPVESDINAGNLAILPLTSLNANSNWATRSDANDMYELSIDGVLFNCTDNTNYIVYRGTANQAVITGLTNNTTYHFRIFTAKSSGMFGSQWSNGVDISGTPSNMQNLFFSEYINGSSNNKAIEIYNPNAVSVDLSQYNVKVYFNGNSTPQATINLTGNIAPLSTYVIANPAANASILSKANLTNGNIAVNSKDDAIALFKGTTMVDLIGDIGCTLDPNPVSSEEEKLITGQTLIRSCSVTTGFVADPNETFCSFPSLGNEWGRYPKDYADNLGTHSCWVAQGTFKSKASGNWSDYNIWQIWNGSTWVDATVSQFPNSTNVNVRIAAGTTVTTDNFNPLYPYHYAKNITVENGGNLLNNVTKLKIGY